MLIQTSGTPANIDAFVRGLPVQPGPGMADLVLLMAERFQRDQSAMSEWANMGKKCVDFFEGKQWDEEGLRKLEAEGRPALTWNKIAPLVRLILGYHRNTRTDTKYRPAHDGSGDQAVSEAITSIVKQAATESDEEYIDTEVFMDGIVTGRGYYDYRLSFEDNDLGTMRAKAKDPFAIYPDCEGDTYDPRDWNRVTEARWVSVDEIEYTYGKSSADMIWGMVHGGAYKGGLPLGLAEVQDEITPWRTFGGTNENSTFGIHAYLANCYDPARKNIRLIDQQHHVRVRARCILDLDTGTRQIIPDTWGDEKVRKVMQWLEERCWMTGKANPFRVVIRPTKRVRWTTMVGDLIVFDAWSPYNTFTLVPFFPYFRRGKTRGAVEDLIDPQTEINKRRSAQIDIVTRTAHAGWMTHENGLSEQEKAKLEQYGAMPGINIEWRGDPSMKPEKIQPGIPPQAMERLEEKSIADLKEISGINDSALGQLDRVQSGRAIEARQKQSVLSIQTYMDNMARTKKMAGRKKLEIIQQHYTEPRIFHILNDDGKPDQTSINTRLITGAILNDVTVGNYSVVIDETPLSASFLSAQFDEMLAMVEKGLLPAPAIMDIAVDISSLPQKDKIKARVANAMAMAGFQSADGVAPGAPIPGQPAAPGLPPPVGGQVPPMQAPQSA